MKIIINNYYPSLPPNNIITHTVMTENDKSTILLLPIRGHEYVKTRRFLGAIFKSYIIVSYQVDQHSQNSLIIGYSTVCDGPQCDLI